MIFAAILPHTKLYGGVKRFFELGDVFVSRGFRFMVITPDGLAPDWYQGPVETVAMPILQGETFQAVFITEMQFLPNLLHAQAVHKVFYFVRANDKVGLLRKHPEIKVFANSPNGQERLASRYGLTAFAAFGGINTRRFYPRPSARRDPETALTVMAYGRLVEKKKGTMLVVRACERLYSKGYNIRLLLFDTPVNEKARKAIEDFNTKVPFDFVVNHPVEKTVELYHRADIFVAAEKNAGSSNTATEAMACGVALIATTSGTKHFLVDNETGLVISRWPWSIRRAIERLIKEPELRQRLAVNGRKKIEEYSWESLAEKIVHELS